MTQKEIGKKYERELRLNASATEKYFKKLLIKTKKAYKLHNVKYYFQKGWYSEKVFYISDFYFPATKCTIELDGQSHNKPGQKLQDQRKTDYLKSIGVRTVRLKNIEAWNLVHPDNLFNFLLRNRVI